MSYPSDAERAADPRLDRWRDVVKSSRWDGVGSGPLLTPEEAEAWTGADLSELMMRVPYVAIGRLRRFIVHDLCRAYDPSFIEPADPNALRDSPDGFIYAIEAVGAARVKIGWTKRGAADRLRELQTSAPFELRVLTEGRGTLAHEHDLHRRLHGHRILPTAEWFHLRGPVLAAIEHAKTHGRWP